MLLSLLPTPFSLQASFSFALFSHWALQAHGAWCCIPWMALTSSLPPHPHPTPAWCRAFLLSELSHSLVTLVALLSAVTLAGITDWLLSPELCSFRAWALCLVLLYNPSAQRRAWHTAGIQETFIEWVNVCREKESGRSLKNRLWEALTDLLFPSLSTCGTWRRLFYL